MPKHKQIEKKEIAFALYFSLADSRSLEKVANELGIALRTLQRWSTQENWANRLKEKGKIIAKEIEEQTLETVANIKSRHAKIAKLVITQYLSQLNDMIKNGIKPDFDVSGLKKMMEHELLAVGALYDQTPTTNPVNLINVNLPPAAQEFRTLMMMLPPEAQIAVTTAIRRMKEMNQNNQAELKKDYVKEGKNGQP